MESKYKIVFRGDVAPGSAMMEVRANLQELFRIDGAAVSKLFMGSPVALKKNLDEATARKWCDVLLKAGAMAEMELEQPIVTESAKELVESVESSDSQSPESPPSSGITMSPVGADVLTPEERAPEVTKDVGTSHLSLDDVGADVLRESERQPFVEREVDLSHLQLEDTKPE